MTLESPGGGTTTTTIAAVYQRCPGVDSEWFAFTTGRTDLMNLCRGMRARLNRRGMLIGSSTARKNENGNCDHHIVHPYLIPGNGASFVNAEIVAILRLRDYSSHPTRFSSGAVSSAYPI